MSRLASREQLEQRVRALDPWFHNIDLDGVLTAPDHFLGDYPRSKWSRFSGALPADLRGKTVLDVGCNAGFYALEMKRRGAEEVVAIDTDARYLAQAELVAEVTGAELELQRLSVYELAKLGRRFDVVLFLGVLYHLRHPLLALDLLAEHAVGDLLVFQTMLRGSLDSAAPIADHDFFERAHFDRPEYPVLHFVEGTYAGDPSNWWIPNAPCAEAMLRSAGFQVFARPEVEVFLCRRAPH